MNFTKPLSAFSTAAVMMAAIFTGYIAPTALGLSQAAQAATAPKLGNLASFRTIAMDVSSLVNKGDLVGAKRRVTDLELAWDGAEAGIKPRSAADWHLVDKSLDKLYSAIRQSKPDVAACQLALTNVLATMDNAEGK